METDRQNTRDRILRSAYQLFYREGFARVSVDAIAARAEVTKRTVYYHFQSKDDIAAAALEGQHDHIVQRFQQWLGPDTSDPVGIVEDLFRELGNWADAAQWLGSGYSRISAELADMPGHPARRAACSHKAKVEDWLSEQFRAAGSADPSGYARQVMILIEGAMSLSLIHGDSSYIDSAKAAAVGLVSGAGSGR